MPCSPGAEVWPGGVWAGIPRSEVGLYDITKEFWEILGQEPHLHLGSGNMEMTCVALQST